MRISDWSSDVCSSDLRSELLLIFSILDDGNININIKSFRAVTARATFLCLCKEAWRKESAPRLRARCCAPAPPLRRGPESQSQRQRQRDRKSTRLNSSH